jgi:calcium-dependent protein kinase
MFKGDDEEELVIDTSQLKNMKRRHTQLGQMAMSNISLNVSPDQVKELKALFLAIDKDGSGTLSLDELKVGLAGREDSFNLMNILKNADTDGSGEIDYTEFIAATID